MSAREQAEWDAYYARIAREAKDRARKESLVNPRRR